MNALTEVQADAIINYVVQAYSLPDVDNAEAPEETFPKWSFVLDEGEIVTIAPDYTVEISRDDGETWEKILGSETPTEGLAITAEDADAWRKQILQGYAIGRKPVMARFWEGMNLPTGRAGWHIFILEDHSWFVVDAYDERVNMWLMQDYICKLGEWIVDDTVRYNARTL